MQYKCTLASLGIEGKGKVTQGICTHVILQSQIAQMKSKRKNKQMKKLVKMMKQVRLVILTCKCVLRSCEN